MKDKESSPAILNRDTGTSGLASLTATIFLISELFKELLSAQTAYRLNWL